MNLPTYGTQYPDLLAPLQVAGTGNLNQYFANPQVAVKPAPYTDGNAPRVLPNARMPGTDNLTASLFKQVPLSFREGARLEIRLEAFNVLNRVQFAAPDTNVGDATFGQITAQANQPRQVQARIKTIFLRTRADASLRYRSQAALGLALVGREFACRSAVANPRRLTTGPPSSSAAFLRPAMAARTSSIRSRAASREPGRVSGSCCSP